VVGATSSESFLVSTEMSDHSRVACTVLATQANSDSYPRQNGKGVQAKLQ